MGDCARVGSSPAWKGMGQYETQGGLGCVCLPEASCGPQTGVGCPGWPFCHAFPQHAPSTPLHSTPPHAPPPLLTRSLAHTRTSLSSLPQAWNNCGTCGTWMWPTTCWGETQGAGATVAADGLRKSEDREPRLRAPPPRMLSGSALFLI